MLSVEHTPSWVLTAECISSPSTILHYILKINKKSENVYQRTKSDRISNTVVFRLKWLEAPFCSLPWVTVLCCLQMWLILNTIFLKCSKLPKGHSASSPGEKQSAQLVKRATKWSEVKVAQSCLTLCKSPWTITCKSPLSMEFSRQEYWSGLPFPSPKRATKVWLNFTLFCSLITHLISKQHNYVSFITLVHTGMHTGAFSMKRKSRIPSELLMLLFLKHWRASSRRRCSQGEWWALS